MSGHTPGPWEFVPMKFNRGQENSCEIGSVKSHRDDENDERFICEIEDAAEYEANARLIAQAPDLYEALSKILWIKDCGIDSAAGHDSAAERDAMYDIARAALAEVDKP